MVIRSRAQPVVLATAADPPSQGSLLAPMADRAVHLVTVFLTCVGTSSHSAEETIFHHAEVEEEQKNYLQRTAVGATVKSALVKKRYSIVVSVGVSPLEFSQMTHWTYVLYSRKDGNFYTGYANKLHHRIREHQSGKVFSTQHRLPVILIYYEVCGNEHDERAREKYLKSGMGKRYLRNRLKRYLAPLQQKNS